MSLYQHYQEDPQGYQNPDRYWTRLEEETVGATHKVTQKKTDNTLEYDTEKASILAMSFAQTYGLIKGLIKFGDKGKHAANEEMKQLHDRKSFRPININDYDRSDRRRVMESIMFLTEKRDGTIKARNVTDGRKQRDWMAHDEAASPGVALETLLLTAVIDAKEHRDVGLVYIPNAFVKEGSPSGPDEGQGKTGRNVKEH
jgi:hypothetical protein